MENFADKEKMKNISRRNFEIIKNYVVNGDSVISERQEGSKLF